MAMPNGFSSINAFRRHEVNRIHSFNATYMETMNMLNKAFDRAISDCQREIESARGRFVNPKEESSSGKPMSHIWADFYLLDSGQGRDCGIDTFNTQLLSLLKGLILKIEKLDGGSRDI